jgi:hypothetical protein
MLISWDRFCHAYAFVFTASPFRAVSILRLMYRTPMKAVNPHQCLVWRKARNNAQRPLVADRSSMNGYAPKIFVIACACCDRPALVLVCSTTVPRVVEKYLSRSKGRIGIRPPFCRSKMDVQARSRTDQVLFLSQHSPYIHKQLIA